MQNLKFRVYHNESKRFLTGEEWLIDFDGNLRFVDFYARNGATYAVTNKNLYVIQQYIGFNDKNGREIYEGDILYGEVDTRTNFDDGAVIGDLYTFKGEVIHDVYIGFYAKEADFGLGDYASLEIMGNICQPLI